MLYALVHFIYHNLTSFLIILMASHKIVQAGCRVIAFYLILGHVSQLHGNYLS